MLNFFKVILFIYLLTVLGLCCCVGFSLAAQNRSCSSCREWASQCGASFYCGAQALLLRGMWDLLGPGIEPMSPALASRFFTTEPLGKPLLMFILNTWEFPDCSVLGCQAFTAEAAGALNPGQGLIGYSPWGLEESDTTGRLHFHFSLSCIGGGNGNPLQCSCLENPRDGGAWWAPVYGVAQSRTRLKWLSSSRGYEGFPVDSVAKNLPANVEDLGLIPGLGRSRLRSHKTCTAPRNFFFDHLFEVVSECVYINTNVRISIFFFFF